MDLEYYPTKSTKGTLAGFYRAIEDYIQNYASQETIGKQFLQHRPAAQHA